MEDRKKILQEEEIDLFKLVKVIWSKKWFVVKVTTVFIILGIIIAFTSKIEFNASCKLLPESQDSSPSLGALGGLAGLAGIELGMGNAGVLSPEIYPEIVNSIPFQLELIQQPLYFEVLDSTLSSYYYFKEVDKPTPLSWILENTVGLPGKVRGLFSTSKSLELRPKMEGIIEMPKEDWLLLESYRGRMNVNVDSKSGVISILTKMPDRIAAAELTNFLVMKLTDKISSYKTEKSLKNLEFIQERYIESEKKYEEKQKKLAQFVDQNKNLSSSLIQTHYQRLQNELNVTFEVYKGLATQLEQSKIKVKEETPVFTVLEPVTVPFQKSEPRRKLILILAIFLGVTFSITIILLRSVLKLF